MIETKINLFNDAMFKAIFRNPKNRKIISEFLSEVTGVKQELLEQANYQGGEIPKKKLEEKGKIADLIIKIEDNQQIIVEMNQYRSNYIFEKNTSYAFSISSESSKKGRREYPRVILVNLDKFNPFQTKEGIIRFQLRDEEGHVETEIYESIHIILENIIDKQYNNNKIKKFIEFMASETIEEMKERYEGDEEYMAAIRTVEELSTDPNFVGYYDLEEAHKQELEDMRETGYDDGMEEGIEKGIEKGKTENQKEVARAMYADGVAIDTISKYVGISIEKIQSLLNEK